MMTKSLEIFLKNSSKNIQQKSIKDDTEDFQKSPKIIEKMPNPAYITVIANEDDELTQEEMDNAKPIFYEQTKPPLNPITKFNGEIGTKPFSRPPVRPPDYKPQDK